MATRIGDLLGQAADRIGARDQILAARVLERANGILGDLLGPEAASYLTPTAYARGELRVAFRAPVAGVTLRQYEAALLEELRKSFPGVRFERLQLLPAG